MESTTQRLTRLSRAALDLAQAPGQRALLEGVLDLLEEHFGRRHGAVLLPHPTCAEGGLRIAAARGYDPELVARHCARPGLGVVGRVLQSGEAVRVPDVSAEAAYVRGVAGAISEVAVPLRRARQVVGVLDVESCRQAPDDEDLALLATLGEQVAWAMEHQAALRRAAGQELLNRAAQAVNAVHEPNALLDQILRLCHQALGFSNVAVLVPDREGGKLVVRRALRPHDIEGLAVPIGAGITGGVFATGAPELVPDVRCDPRYIPGGMGGRGSEMVAPLRLNGEVIGVLDAEAEEPEAFSEVDLELFSTFAHHVATALRSAELVQSLEDRAGRLQAITRTSRALNRVLDPEEMLHRILESVSEALGLDRAAVLLLEDAEQACGDAAGRSLVIHAARGYQNVVGARIPAGHGVTGQVALSGEPVLVHDIRHDPRYLPGIEGGAAEMAVPLRLHNELFGVLDSESTEPWAFDEGDLELFHAFADQAAVALCNARLFQRLQRSNQQLKRNVKETARLNAELESYAGQIAEVNQSLQVQIGQLQTLHRAGRAITASLDLQQVLDTILQMAGELLASSAGAIRLLDQESQEWREVAHAGDCGERPDRVRVDLPLKIGERTIGVFELLRPRDQDLDDGEVAMLQTLASQAAIAIENSRLFEGTQQIYYDTLTSLARALEARDDYTRGHSERVASLALLIAHELALPEEQCGQIRDAALLHDIGKIGVRDAVLLSPDKLSAEEWAAIRKHPTFGNIILGPLKFLGDVSRQVKHHHERWDGGGYPSGLAGEAIPLASRIIGVADTYDAMTSDRPYRRAATHDQAVAEIRRQAGSQFDPEVVEAFLSVARRRGALRPRPTESGPPPAAITPGPGQLTRPEGR